MFRLLAISIDVISVSVFLIPIFPVILKCFGENRDQRERVLLFLFALYVSAVFSAVGIPNVQTVAWIPSIHVIPLIDIVNSPFSYLKNSVLNVLLFVPLGFLSPLLWKEFCTKRAMLWLGIGSSLFIEFIQIFTLRLTDIDDIIMNTAGALLGFACVKRLLKCQEGVWNAGCDSDGRDRRELLAVFALVFLLMFFISPFLENVLWEWYL